MFAYQRKRWGQVEGALNRALDAIDAGVRESSDRACVEFPGAELKDEIEALIEEVQRIRESEGQ